MGITDIPCERRHGWRHRSDGGFNPDRYGVALIGQPAAKSFILANHYAGSFPSDKYRFGMVDLWLKKLCGVAVLSIPGGNNRVLTSVFPGLEVGVESLELGRVTLLDEVPPNGESHFVGEVLRIAAGLGVRGVLSFADPAVMFDKDGKNVKRGHWGCWDQAVNLGSYGRSCARTHHVLPDGSLFSPVAMQKIRTQASGHEYAERRLMRWGARPRRAFEDPKEWLRRELPAATRGRTFRHPGNIRYLGAIGETRAQRRSVLIKPERDRQYPKAEVLVHGPGPLKGYKDLEVAA